MIFVTVIVHMFTLEKQSETRHSTCIFNVSCSSNDSIVFHTNGMKLKFTSELELSVVLASNANWNGFDTLCCKCNIISEYGCIITILWYSI